MKKSENDGYMIHYVDSIEIFRIRKSVRHNQLIARDVGMLLPL